MGEDFERNKNIMTKEEWALLEKALSGVFGSVELEVDGRRVSFERCLITKNRLGCMTYVDGKFNGVWLLAGRGHAESKYLQSRSRYLHTPKQRNEMKKMGKRFLTKYDWDPDKKIVQLDPIWPSGAAIRRYYQKTFTAIKLTKVNGVAHP